VTDDVRCDNASTSLARDTSAWRSPRSRETVTADGRIATPRTTRGAGLPRTRVGVPSPLRSPAGAEPRRVGAVSRFSEADRMRRDHSDRSRRGGQERDNGSPARRHSAAPVRRRVSLTNQRCPASTGPARVGRGRQGRRPTLVPGQRRRRRRSCSKNGSIRQRSAGV
jgi:hypothetical protein